MLLQERKPKTESANHDQKPTGETLVLGTAKREYSNTVAFRTPLAAEVLQLSPFFTEKVSFIVNLSS